MARDTKSNTQPTISQTSLESGSVDDAWLFLNKSRHANADASVVDIRALRRKVDWHIVPLMFGCYTMQFLDKVILNVCPVTRYKLTSRLSDSQYAAVMGIQKDLHLVGNDFSNVATFLFVGLLCFEVPNGMAIVLSQSNYPYVYSLLSPEGPSGEVARSECRSLGNCHC